MDMKLQKAADIVRNAVKEILVNPVPEAMSEDKFDMYIPNFRLEDDRTATVRIIVEPTRMLMVSNLGDMLPECRESVTEAMNRQNNEMTHTRAVLYNGHINIEAGSFLYTDSEHENERVEKMIMHYLRHLQISGVMLLDANTPSERNADEDDDDLDDISGIDFHLFDS